MGKRRAVNKKNRLLDPKEVELLLSLSVSSETLWRILIATRDDDFYRAVQNLFSGDENVQIMRVASGCDALIYSARCTPDLLVTDAELPDLSCRVMAECMRRDTELNRLKILCRLNGHIPSDFDEWGVDDYITGENDLDKVYLSRKLHSLLYAADLGSGEHAAGSHERRWPRTRLNITARVGLFGPDGAQPLGEGQAVVENISVGGAYLSDIRIEDGTVPPEVSLVQLSIDQPFLRDWNAESVMVRFRPNGSAGIRFVNMSKDDRLKIMNLFEG